MMIPIANTYMYSGPGIKQDRCDKSQVDSANTNAAAVLAEMVIVSYVFVNNAINKFIINIAANIN